MVHFLILKTVIRELIRIIIEAVSMKTIYRFDFNENNNINNQS